MSLSSTQSALQVLEWERFLSLAAHEALSIPAQDSLHALQMESHWAASCTQAQILQTETSEIKLFLDKDSLWNPLNGLQSPLPALSRLQRDSVLEVTDLALLRNWLQAAAVWTEASTTPSSQGGLYGERLLKNLQEIPSPHAALHILRPLLTPQGELSESATPSLAQLHSEIRGLKREITHRLDQLIKEYHQKGVLQETYSDVRDGRYVLPVRISAQSEVEGTLYESSGSRQTVFIEPKEVSLLNQRLRQRQSTLAQEIQQILTETCRKLQPHTPDILRATEILIHWDATQAKARLGRHYQGLPLTVGEGRSFSLKKSAHPLLFWSLPDEDIIRNDITLESPRQALLLTGPNTGGKTVLLKTLGMAGLCARTGFPFPTSEPGEAPYFDQLFADLGDPQSIEQHLSSFSGHVLRFKEILEQVTPQSLVLLDELNSATDPEEGAAFGRAVLEQILQSGALLITTTHDPHLKSLSLKDPRILCASMAFDESSQTPTFHILFGIPGRSRALETAKRLGMPESLILLAKSYLSEHHLDLEARLQRLEADSAAATLARAEAERLLAQAKALEALWIKKTESGFEDLLSRTQNRLRKTLEKAQSEIRERLIQLESSKSRSEVQQLRRELLSSLETHETELKEALQTEAPERSWKDSKNAQTPDQTPHARRLFTEGTSVRVARWKSTGSILKLKGDQHAEIALGALKLTLPLSELEWLAPPPKKRASHIATQLSTSNPQSGSRSERSESELDIRGLRYEAAMTEVEHFLNHAHQNQRLRVTIIHGLGTGALREGTLRLLRSLPFVKTFQDGGPQGGGAGATFIELDPS
jgi:DNA mismatch repair protein MutS2